jgi:hypothetical protein
VVGVNHSFDLAFVFFIFPMYYQQLYSKNKQD